MHFEWDREKSLFTLRKHKTTFDEASTVFDDPLAIIFDNEKIMKKTQDAKQEKIVADDLKPEYNFNYDKRKPNRFAGKKNEKRVVVVLDLTETYFRSTIWTSCLSLTTQSGG